MKAVHQNAMSEGSAGESPRDVEEFIISARVRMGGRGVVGKGQLQEAFPEKSRQGLVCEARGWKKL